MSEPFCAIKHTAVADNSSLFDSNNFSFLFFLSPAFADCFMFVELESTRTSPTWGESFALAGSTRFFDEVVLLVRMFARAFEVLGTVYWDVIEVVAFTTYEFTFDFIVCSLQEVMVFVRMITEAFWGRTYILAV